MRSVTAADPKARADIEDNFRKTVGQALGGLFVLIGAGLAYNGTLQTLQANQQQFTAQQDTSRQQFTAQQETARQQLEEQQKASRDLLISNQVAKGFELFGSNNTFIRLGGIYALAGVMNTSEQYYQPILVALCAFVRDNTRTATGDAPPPIDIQAALTMIGRRTAIGTGVPDLSNAHIPRANLAGADLRQAELGGANLGHALLAGANLSWAQASVLRFTHVLPLGPHTAVRTDRVYGGSADIMHGEPSVQFTYDIRTADKVDLSGADLFNANLSDANLVQADLSGTVLSGANLTNARIERVDLTKANLAKAVLTGALLTDAKLDGADLSKATVSQTQVDQACGTNVKLDPGLTIKPCSAGGSSKQ